LLPQRQRAVREHEQRIAITLAVAEYRLSFCGALATLITSDQVQSRLVLAPTLTTAYFLLIRIRVRLG
jgi:hypothetical protein